MVEHRDSTDIDHTTPGDDDVEASKVVGTNCTPVVIYLRQIHDFHGNIILYL